MKRVLISAAVLASMFSVAPAIAQSPYGGGWNSNEFWREAPRDSYDRIQFLQQRIDRGVADGSLTRNEARRAQSQLRLIQQDAWQMRRRNGGVLTPRDAAAVQTRLDDLGRNLRWMRRNGNGAYAAGYDQNRFTTNYDAAHYYRDGPSYRERRLGASDEVYRGSDGRYYCKRNDGTTGLIVGAAAGGVLGNVIDGGHNRVAGTLVGGALGALLGKSIDQNSDIRCR